jgi:hypothetical protein
VNVPAEINGKPVVLFGELPEPSANQPGEPETVAVAVVRYPAEPGEGEFHEALELDANGHFIPPYDWAVVPSVQGWLATDPYPGVGWKQPLA